MTFINEPTVKIGGTDTNANLDAFHRLRVSNPLTLFDSQTHYDDLTSFLWVHKLVTNGTTTFLADEASVRLNVTAENGSRVVRQTRAYLRYQPGKSQFILITFNFGTGQANTKKRAGYFDDNNGIFIEEENGSIWFVKRSSTTGSVVDTRIAQADWNIDRNDGTGPSGITFDGLQGHLLVIDLEWLSMGSVRIGFIHRGQIQYAHRFDHTNLQALPYMTTANLPIRYEIVNTAGAAGTNNFVTICSTVMSEGGFEEQLGIPFSSSNGATTISVTTQRAVLSIRPKTTFNSIENRGTVKFVTIDALVSTNDVFVEIFYNTALTSASFASVDDNSIMEFDVATTITGGHRVATFFVSSGLGVSSGAADQRFLARVPVGLDVDGANPDTLSIVVTSVGGGAAPTSAAISWIEYR